MNSPKPKGGGGAPGAPVPKKAASPVPKSAPGSPPRTGEPAEKKAKLSPSVVAALEKRRQEARAKKAAKAAKAAVPAKVPEAAKQASGKVPVASEEARALLELQRERREAAEREMQDAFAAQEGMLGFGPAQPPVAPEPDPFAEEDLLCGAVPLSVEDELAGGATKGKEPDVECTDYLITTGNLPRGLKGHLMDATDAALLGLGAVGPDGKVSRFLCCGEEEYSASGGVRDPNGEVHYHLQLAVLIVLRKSALVKALNAEYAKLDLAGAVATAAALARPVPTSVTAARQAAQKKGVEARRVKAAKKEALSKRRKEAAQARWAKRKAGAVAVGLLTDAGEDEAEPDLAEAADLPGLDVFADLGGAADLAALTDPMESLLDSFETQESQFELDLAKTADLPGLDDLGDLAGFEGALVPAQPQVSGLTAAGGAGSSSSSAAVVPAEPPVSNPPDSSSAAAKQIRVASDGVVPFGFLDGADYILYPSSRRKKPDRNPALRGISGMQIEVLKKQKPPSKREQAAAAVDLVFGKGEDPHPGTFFEQVETHPLLAPHKLRLNTHFHAERSARISAIKQAQQEQRDFEKAQKVVAPSRWAAAKSHSNSGDAMCAVFQAMRKEKCPFESAGGTCQFKDALSSWDEGFGKTHFQYKNNSPGGWCELFSAAILENDIGKRDLHAGQTGLVLAQGVASSGKSYMSTHLLTALLASAGEQGWQPSWHASGNVFRSCGTAMYDPSAAPDPAHKVFNKQSWLATKNWRRFWRYEEWDYLPQTAMSAIKELLDGSSYECERLGNLQSGPSDAFSVAHPRGGWGTAFCTSKSTMGKAPVCTDDVRGQLDERVLRLYVSPETSQGATDVKGGKRLKKSQLCPVCWVHRVFERLQTEATCNEVVYYVRRRLCKLLALPEPEGDTKLKAEVVQIAA